MFILHLLFVDIRLAQTLLNNCLQNAVNDSALEQVGEESATITPEANYNIWHPTIDDNSILSLDANDSGNDSLVPEICDEVFKKDDNGDNVGKFNWSSAATLLFIEEYEKLAAKFSSGKYTQKECYDLLSIKLNEKGYKVCGRKCATKLLSLKRQYKAVTDHNSKSGNDQKEWIFLEQMHNLFGKKPWIKPLSVASSSKRTTKSATASNMETYVENIDNTDSDDNYTEPRYKVQLDKRCKAKRNYLQEFVECKRKAAEDKEIYYKAKLAHMDTISALLTKLTEKENK